MFADNWKISLRQIKRLLILDLFGLSSLLLPGMLGRLNGGDGIFCLLAGMAGGMLLLALIQANLKQMKGSFYLYLKDTAGQLLADIIMVFCLLYFVSLSGYVLYEEITMILAWLLPEGGYWQTALLLLALGAYGVFRGIEGRARVYEILFWFLGIPLAVMLAFALGKVNTDYWTPLVSSSGAAFWQGSLSAWIFLVPLVSLLFLKPFCQKPEKLCCCGRTAVFAVTGANIVIYLILAGVFGQHTLQVLNRPVITLMSMINLPGGFFTRQDVLMTSVWFFTLFALFHTGLFQSSLILRDLCQTKKTGYSLSVALILVFLMASGFFRNSLLTQIYSAYLKWMVLPGFLGILLLLWVLGKIRGKKKEEAGEVAGGTPCR